MTGRNDERRWSSLPAPIHTSSLYSVHLPVHRSRSIVYYYACISKSDFTARHCIWAGNQVRVRFKLLAQKCVCGSSSFMSQVQAVARFACPILLSCCGLTIASSSFSLSIACEECWMLAMIVIIRRKWQKRWTDGREEAKWWLCERYKILREQVVQDY